MKQTVKNLAMAFSGESKARNRYTFYAKTAKKEGYEKIAEVFQITADNETEHAKWFFRMLNDVLKRENLKMDAIEVPDVVPTTLGNTIENLEAAINGEHHEYSKLYPEFADTAEKEGFPKIAERIRAISKAEEHHEERFKKLLQEVKNETMFKKDGKQYWVCRKCGYVHEGPEPPEHCPSCSHPKNYFEIKCEQY